LTHSGLLRRVAALPALALLALGAVMPSADGYTFVPIFDDDVVACVEVESTTYVALPCDSATLAQAVGAPVVLTTLRTVVDALPCAPGVRIEFHGCRPCGDADSRMDAKGCGEAPCVPLPGFCQAVLRRN
jgi:hypothetical protein